MKVPAGGINRLNVRPDLKRLSVARQQCFLRKNGIII